VRREPQIAATPIVLVSAHDGAADRLRGHEVGADSFLSKKECMSGRLLAEVAAAIARKQASA
jgi:CheY-like chemotaxis protein